MFLHLLHIRWRAFVNSVRHGGKKSRRRLLSYIGLVALPVIVLANMIPFLNVMVKLPQFGDPAVYMMMRGMLMGFFLMLLFSGMTLVLHIFFLSKDLPLLLSTPITLSTIFQFKFFEATLANSALFFGMALPIIIAGGIVTHASIWFYLYLPVASLIFLSIPTGISAFLAFGLVTIMPARRAKSLAAVLLSIVSIAIWAGFQLLRPEKISGHAGSTSSEAISHYLDLSNRISVYFPSDWFTNSIFAVAQKQYAPALLYLGLLLAGAATLHGFTRSLMQRALARDVFSGVDTRARRKITNGARTQPYGNTSIYWTFVQRDFKLVIRDSQQLTQLILFTLMMVLIPLFNSQTADEMQGVYTPYMPFLFLFVFSILIGGSMAARFIPMERTAFGLCKLAPIRLRTVWLAKITVSFLLTVGSGLAAVLINSIIHKTPADVITRISLFLLAADLGTTALGGVFGALFPNFLWDHPKRMLSSGGNLTMTVVILVYMAVLGGIVALSSFIFASIDAGLILSALLALFLLGFGTVISERKLDKIEWQH